MAEMFKLVSPKFGTSWVCSHCDHEFKATPEFRLHVTCPYCQNIITHWDEEE